jgi:hypothetical protein
VGRPAGHYYYEQSEIIQGWSMERAKPHTDPLSMVPYFTCFKSATVSQFELKAGAATVFYLHAALGELTRASPTLSTLSS